MNLGTYRHINETNVINGIFALDTATGSKGRLLQIQGSGHNPVENDGWGPALPGNDESNNTYSARYEIKARVTAAGPNSATVLGMQLYDVKESNAFGEHLMYRPVERAERQIVLSGQAVPIVTKGLLEVIDYSGTASGNAIGYVADEGILAAAPVGTTGVAGSPINKVGTFLGISGRNGGALFQLDIK